MTDTAKQPEAGGSSPSGKVEPRHFVRMVTIWLVLALVADLLFWFLVGPHVPPGTMTSTAEENQFDFNVLMVIAFPVLIGVWVYLGYSLVTWRASKGGDDPVGGERLSLIHI